MKYYKSHNKDSLLYYTALSQHKLEYLQMTFACGHVSRLRRQMARFADEFADILLQLRF